MELCINFYLKQGGRSTSGARAVIRDGFKFGLSGPTPKDQHKKAEPFVTPPLVRTGLNRLRERIPRCLGRGERPFIKLAMFLAVLRSSAVRENIPRGLPRGVFNSRAFHPF